MILSLVNKKSHGLKVPHRSILGKINHSYDLSEGIYSIICEVDPNLTLDDFYLSNNVARATFEVGAACIDDDDRNEGPRTATPLAWSLDEASYAGVICSLTEDWWVMTVPAGEELSN